MPDVRICFFGDSFTAGIGDPDCLGWTGRVCRSALARDPSLELTAYNLGVRRDTSRDIADRWETELAPRLPACVDARLVFSFGTNDMTVEGRRLRVSPESSVRNAGDILSAALELCPVLMIGPAPVADSEHNGRIRDLSARYARLCDELGVPYLDAAGALLAEGTWAREAAAGDGAHPGVGGYSQLALLVDAWPEWRAWFP